MLKLKGKKVFNQIKKHALTLVSNQNIRNWGYSITLRSDISSANSLIYDYREKFLIFHTKESIILESHAKHSEVLISDISFDYILERNGSLKKYKTEPFERVFISKGCKHKIINSNELDLNIFEIQTGEILNNDKIQYLEQNENV